METSTISQLRINFPIIIQEQPFHLVQCHQHHVQIRALEQFHFKDESIHMEQTQWRLSPYEVGEGLNQHWQPIWNSQPNSLDFMRDGLEHPSFEAITPVPEHIHVDLDNEASWMTAIQSLKAHAARGIDAISAYELKLLPFDLITAILPFRTQGP